MKKIFSLLLVFTMSLSSIQKVENSAPIHLSPQSAFSSLPLSLSTPEQMSLGQPHEKNPRLFVLNQGIGKTREENLAVYFLKDEFQKVQKVTVAYTRSQKGSVNIEVVVFLPGLKQITFNLEKVTDKKTSFDEEIGTKVLEELKKQNGGKKKWLMGIGGGLLITVLSTFLIDTNKPQVSITQPSSTTKTKPASINEEIQEKIVAAANRVVQHIEQGRWTPPAEAGEGYLQRLKAFAQKPAIKFVNNPTDFSFVRANRATLGIEVNVATFPEFSDDEIETIIVHELVHLSQEQEEMSRLAKKLFDRLPKFQKSIAAQTALLESPVYREDLKRFAVVHSYKEVFAYKTEFSYRNSVLKWNADSRNLYQYQKEIVEKYKNPVLRSRGTIFLECFHKDGSLNEKVFVASLIGGKLTDLEFTLLETIARKYEGVGQTGDDFEKWIYEYAKNPKKHLVQKGELKTESLVANLFSGKCERANWVVRLLLASAIVPHELGHYIQAKFAHHPELKDVRWHHFFSAMPWANSGADLSGWQINLVLTTVSGVYLSLVGFSPFVLVVLISNLLLVVFEPIVSLFLNRGDFKSVSFPSFFPASFKNAAIAFFVAVLSFGESVVAQGIQFKYGDYEFNITGEGLFIWAGLIVIGIVAMAFLSHKVDAILEHVRHIFSILFGKKEQEENPEEPLLQIDDLQESFEKLNKENEEMNKEMVDPPSDNKKEIQESKEIKEEEQEKFELSEPKNETVFLEEEELPKEKNRKWPVDLHTMVQGVNITGSSVIVNGKKIIVNGVEIDGNGMSGLSVVNGKVTIQRGGTGYSVNIKQQNESLEHKKIERVRSSSEEKVNNRSFTISGQGNKKNIDANYSRIEIQGMGNKGEINGDQNKIDISGQGNKAEIIGDGNKIEVSGQGNKIEIKGNENRFVVSGMSNKIEAKGHNNYLDSESGMRNKIDIVKSDKFLKEKSDVKESSIANSLISQSSDPIKDQAQAFFEVFRPNKKEEKVVNSLISSGQKSHQNFELKSGMKVGKYILDEKIRAGGMGIVYKAHDWQGGDTGYVAIKVVPQQYKERFLQEVALLQRVTGHSNILQMIGRPFQDEAGNYYFYVMPLLEPFDSTKNRMPEEIKNFVIQLADALGFIHRKEIIHRDIKPDNILVDKWGDPFLIDFGLGKDQEKPTSLTKANAVLGTVRYMAPEQLDPESGDIDARADIYALGLILAEMVLQEPIVTSDVQVASYREKQNLSSKLDEKINDLEICLKANILSSYNFQRLNFLKVAKKALNFNKKDRFQNASSFIQALKSANDKIDIFTVKNIEESL